jgi:hypothetical protein
VVVVWLKLLRFFKPASLAVCSFFLSFLFVSVVHLEFPIEFFYL